MDPIDRRILGLLQNDARLTQAERAIDWARDDTQRVLRKLNAADGFPGVADSLFGQPCHLFNARRFAAYGEPGTVLGRVGDGVVRATVDGAVWLGQAKRAGGIKLPVVVAFPELAELAPAGTRRMGDNPHANGGLLLRDLQLLDFRDFAVDVPTPGTVTGVAVNGSLTRCASARMWVQ